MSAPPHRTESPREPDPPALPGDADGSVQPSRRGMTRLIEASSVLAQGMSFRRALAWSMGLHVVAPPALLVLLLLSMILLSWLLRWDIWSWLRPAEKPTVTFTLVAESDAPPPESPRFKGAFNQQAGGVPDEKRPLQPTVSPEPPAPAPPPAPEPVSETPPEPVQSPPVSPTVATQPAEHQTPPPVSEQVVSQTLPERVDVVASALSTAGRSILDGLLPNPQQGMASTPGVDVVQDADFAPIMADLTRRIRRNWHPPRGSENRKVTLLFYLARDGQVVKIETKTSSGDEEADQAAIEAVEASAPFLPLPPEAPEQILPVEFTFDYNVLNPKNARRALKW